MENNDYTNLDWLFPNSSSPMLNEDTSAGKEEPPAVAPSVSVNNPPDTKIPADQKKTDKPAEDMPKFKCPKCMSESAATDTKGKYKCAKCGQTFSVDETIKEAKERKGHKIVIELETGNAAFDENEAEAIEHILKGSIQQREDGSIDLPDDRKLKDRNGNTVGSIKVTEL